MRYWDRLSNPNTPVSRSRNVIRSVPGTVSSQWGQRPLFSEPGPDQPPPEEGELGSEARLEEVHPADRTKGSEDRSDLILDEPSVPVVLTHSNTNVANPPTAAQLEASFGPRPTGFTAFVQDGGSAGVVWLCIRAVGGNLWHYVKFTGAV